VLDRQQEVENTMVGRTALYRDLLVGLLGALPRPAAIVGLDGLVLASTLDAAADALIEQEASKIPAVDRGADGAELMTEKGAVGLRLLRVGTQRPLAWLATMAKPA
jgi:hypothetical protein